MVPGILSGKAAPHLTTPMAHRCRQNDPSGTLGSLPPPHSTSWIRFSNSVSSKLGSTMVFFLGPASPVITTVPRLRIAANAAAMTSSVTTPTVISASSAPTPSVTISCAVSASACADCPQDLMRGILGQAFGIPPDTTDLTYPSTSQEER